MNKKTVCAILGLCVVGAVVIALAAVFPRENEAVQETFETLAVISAVRDDVNAYHATINDIPALLTEEDFLNNAAVQHAALWQPYINSRFVYERINTAGYRICASFAAVPSEETRRKKGYAGQFEFSSPGGTCFDLKVK